MGQNLGHKVVDAGPLQEINHRQRYSQLALNAVAQLDSHERIHAQGVQGLPAGQIGRRQAQNLCCLLLQELPGQLCT